MGLVNNPDFQLESQKDYTSGVCVDYKQTILTTIKIQLPTPESKTGLRQYVPTL